MFRLMRLLGKYSVEAINDRSLNAIFLAVDTVVPAWAEQCWKEGKRCKPLHDPGLDGEGSRAVADARALHENAGEQQQ